MSIHSHSFFFSVVVFFILIHRKFSLYKPSKKSPSKPFVSIIPLLLVHRYHRGICKLVCSPICPLSFARTSLIIRLTIYFWFGGLISPFIYTVFVFKYHFESMWTRTYNIFESRTKNHAIFASTKRNGKKKDNSAGKICKRELWLVCFTKWRWWWWTSSFERKNKQ